MVVVLPEPLTPTTRITCGRGKASISSGSATGREDLLQLLRDHRADRLLAEAALEPLAGEPGAHLGRGPRAEVGGDQRLLDLVERRLVQRGLGDQAGEIVAEPVGGLAEAEPHALVPGRLRSRGSSDQDAVLDAGDPHFDDLLIPRKRIRPGAGSPLRDTDRTGAKFSAWPKPSFSTSTRCRVPTRPSSHAALRAAQASRRRRARSLAIGGRDLGHARRRRATLRREGEDVAHDDVAFVDQAQRILVPSPRSRSGSRRSGRRRSRSRAASPSAAPPSRPRRRGCGAASSASGSGRRRPGSSYGGAA